MIISLFPKKQRGDVKKGIKQMKKIRKDAEKQDVTQEIVELTHLLDPILMARLSSELQINHRELEELPITELLSKDRELLKAHNKDCSGRCYLLSNSSLNVFLEEVTKSLTQMGTSEEELTLLLKKGKNSEAQKVK